MYDTNDLDKIKELVLSLVFNAEDIILFGSYARGNANSDSDLDFAILTKSEIERSEKLTLLAKIRRAIAVLGYNADIIIKNKNVYLSEISLPTLSRTIQNEGKYIWSRT
ncbi:MAG: nucleotidyltransferase domain-containing protein [FCB group bacterium]|jgi:predicted nucleotidyltransferase